ncbi:Ribonuclease MRP protein subunit rmp1 [Rhinocladiella similis]
MATKKSQSARKLTTSSTTAERPAKRRKLSPPSTASGSLNQRSQEKPSKKAKTAKPIPKKGTLPRPPRQRRPLQLRALQSRFVETRKKPSLNTSKPTSKSNSGLSTPSSSDISHKTAFTKSLLDQIWTRNKNQHRSQPWWKCLGMLKKAITQLALLDDRESQLRQTGGSGGALADATAVRRRFEQEAQIRSEREVWTEWVRETLVPRSYVAFTSLVSDTQFANLGVVLVGALADVVSIAGPPTPTTATTSKMEPPIPSLALATDKPITSDNNHRKATRLTATSLRVTGLRSGEQVERLYDSDDMGEVVERRTTPKNENEKSKAPPSSPPRPPIQKDTKDMIADRANASTGTRSSKGAVQHVLDNDGDDEVGEETSVQNRPQFRENRAQLNDTPSSLSNALTNQSQPKKPLPPSSSTTSRQKPVKKPASKDKKKKKGKTSAIDDLFAGLV